MPSTNLRILAEFLLSGSHVPCDAPRGILQPLVGNTKSRIIQMSQIRSTIEEVFSQALLESGETAATHFPDDLILLQSGIDSLGFAIIVTRLEQELGFDPFILATEAFYPVTFGEFVSLYERYAPGS
jgi:acyl carrier protein